MERIVIINFGAQYNQLIARRVREAGVYSELLPPDSPIEKIKGDGLCGIILSGGPDSAYLEGARTCSDELFNLGSARAWHLLRNAAYVPKTRRQSRPRSDA